MDLETRLTELYNDLGGMKDHFHDSGAVGRLFNALLTEVKTGHPDDSVVAAVEELGFGTTGQTAGSPEATRVVVGQLLTVVRE